MSRSRADRAVRTGILLVLGACALPAAEGATLKAGFPKQIPNVGWARESRPVFGNFGFVAGKKSLVFGTSGILPSSTDPGGIPTTGGYLCVVNPDGTVPSGFPKLLPAEVNTVAVGDLDGDGKDDIVVGYRSTFNDGNPADKRPGGVRAFLSSLGWGYWDRPGLDFNGDGVAEGVYSTPAIADVDGDGFPEVAWGGFDGRLYLVDGRTGADEPGWPLFMKDTIWSSPALFDLDGDGKREVIVGTDTHGDGEVVLGTPTPYGGCLWAIRPNASVVSGFPYCISQVIWSSPAVGDINGDGQPEIVFGTGQYTSDPGNPNFSKYIFPHKLYAITRNGLDAPGWPASLPSNEDVGTSPALVDLDGDGTPEVVATSFASASGGKSRLYAFRGNGTVLGSVLVTTSEAIPRSDFSAGDPVAADVSGNGDVEILVPYNWEVVLFDKALVQLTSYAGPHFSLWGPVSAVASGDMEGDGLLEMAVAASGHTGVIDVNESAATVWEMKNASAPAWGVFHQGPARLGVYPGTSAPARFYTIVPPCRIVDTRLPAGPLGGPSLSAQQTRALTLAGACGVAVDAKAVSLNLTVADATAAGSLTVFPGTGAAPGTNTISFVPSKNRANNVTMGLLGGQLSVLDLQTTGTVNLILDVNGYYR